MATLSKITLYTQATFSAIAVLLCAFYGIRCLLAGNLFCALCFAAACNASYHFFFPDSLKPQRHRSVKQDGFR